MDDVTPPRALEPDELAELSDMLKEHLILSAVPKAQAEDDAEDLLNYAFDLIGDGVSVGEVISEVDDLGLEICSAESLDGMRKSLADYFIALGGGGGGSAQKSSSGGGGGSSDYNPLVQSIRDESKAKQYGGGPGINCDPTAFYMKQNKGASSFKTREAAKKNAQEQNMKYDYKYEGGGGGGSAEGSSASSPQSVKESLGDKSVDDMRREELMAIMKDRTLSKEEKARMSEEVRAKYGGGGGVDSPQDSPAPSRRPVHDDSSNGYDRSASGGAIESTGSRKMGYAEQLQAEEKARGEKVLKNTSRVTMSTQSSAGGGVVEGKGSRKMGYAEQLQEMERARGEAVSGLDTLLPNADMSHSYKSVQNNMIPPHRF